MKKTRYTETQIIKILKEVEGGRMVKEVCREYGIQYATYYNWKSKYGGMTASDQKKLENENRRLKRMFADLSLQHDALKDVIEKKALRPAEKRKLVDYMRQTHGLSQRGACCAIGISRLVYHYQPNNNKDDPVI